ncbi:MAG: 6-carboxytetrahydropterin synthase QueD [Candidatus Eremiobacteraeota bacterium]|nr:6-carboxytetrahydropterin synthase QueD [Candidatus Eremiobacteraeota bacterium]MBV9647343.1 6-carboxytetrahydropterin synthase QueD [Candidatus Eremiobacteraeota bacterium]
MRVRKAFSFEAAHVLPNHPGKCSRLHGHSYRLDVAVDGPLHDSGPSAGMVIDFDAIAEIVQREIIERVDHQSLNDVVENPTSELVAAWMWNRLAPALPGLAELVLWETSSACAVVTANDMRGGA